MNSEELITLFHRYRNNQCTAAEAERLIHHIKSGRDGQLVEELIGRISPDEFMADPDMQASLDRVFRKVQEAKPHVAARRAGVRKLPWRWAAAAAVLIGVSVAVWNAVGTAGRKPQAVDLKITDIAPGGNRATLTFTDGRTIALSDAQSGIVVGSERITYADTLVSVASLGDGKSINPSEMLSLSTPAGGTYQITLPDGTKVWLNAASTLTYPSKFAAGERRVTLSGEGYFDVVPDKSKPFRVESRGQEVEVLGTRFNIAAYPDEAETVTTLVEGAVRLGTAGKHVTLAPGEQGILGEGSIHVEAVDVGGYVGWTNGEFVFNGIELRDAMRRLARWYDVEVAYEGDVQPTPFYGSFSRSLSLSETLAILKEANINFSVERIGSKNRLIVKP